jgi:hypothetical protein
MTLAFLVESDRVNVDFSSRAISHRGLDLAAPSEPESPASLSIRCARLVRRDLLGGLIHEYELAA